MKTPRLDYRQDIDGLRAVAVLGVVFYHFSRSLLPGGFVGVDIFFVISGYLITRIIVHEIGTESFSFAGFYMRRVRRIFPAFFVMVLCVFWLSFVLLLPEDMKDMANSALFAALAVSNVFFWRNIDSGYFADSSDAVVLLNTWSLGVEEQFYLLWPVVLVCIALVARKNKGLPIVVALITVLVSFGLSEYSIQKWPQFAFFMLPARAGELMIGAIAALALHRHSLQDGSRYFPRHGVRIELTACCALALILYSFFQFDQSTPFPGLRALLPCVGAAGVILVGSRSRLVGLLLTSPPVVGIGLISYSLYLWHWPLLAFHRYFFAAMPVSHTILLAVIIGLVSVTSYIFVETPARRSRMSRSSQLLFFCVVPLIAVALGRMAIAYPAFEQFLVSSTRPTASSQHVRDTTRAAFEYSENCQQSTFDPTILEQERCLVGDRTRKADILLWGDSHAAHHLGLLDTIGQKNGIALRNASVSTCPPVFDGHYGDPVYGPGCDAFRELIKDRLLGKREYSLVILGGHWAKYGKEPYFRDAVELTVRQLTAANISVVLLGEIPVIPGYVRERPMRWARLGRDYQFSAVPQLNSPMEGFLRHLAEHNPLVSYMHVQDVLCADGRCKAEVNGHPVYFDQRHLSMDGSRRIGKYLLDRGQAGKWIRMLTGKRQVDSLPDDRGAAMMQVSTGWRDD